MFDEDLDLPKYHPRKYIKNAVERHLYKVRKSWQIYLHATHISLGRYNMQVVVFVAIINLLGNF